MAIMKTRSKVVIEEDDSSEPDVQNISNSDVEISDHSDSEINGKSDDNIEGNLGWVDSIAKILKSNKPKSKKTIVLSKAKKLTDLRRPKTKESGFEVQTEDGTVVQDQIVEDNLIKEDTEQPLRKKRKELPSFRVKPDILQKDRERMLSKIATKGVVQLFNAVKQQQKDIHHKLEDAGPLEVKRDKVLKNIDKRQFLNVLMGDKSQAVKESSINANNFEVRKDEVKEPSWGILRDDFMMGAKLKDWDKDLENENEMEYEQIESE